MFARARKSFVLPAALVVLAAFGVLTYRSRVDLLYLQEPAILSGWVLVGLFLFLGLFNVRKKFPNLPLGRMSFWLYLHALVGLLAAGVYFLHTGALWPRGGYERMIAGLFYLVALTGIVGYVYQRLAPRLLTQVGYEIIWERIPAEIARLRKQAEGCVLHCSNETGSPVLGRHYLECLQWYFRKPRFLVSSAISLQTGESWVDKQIDAVRRYLNEAETVHLERLRELARVKARVDKHYAIQGLLKLWLFLHLPLTLGLLIAVGWHVALVHVYGI